MHKHKIGKDHNEVYLEKMQQYCRCKYLRRANIFLKKTTLVYSRFLKKRYSYMLLINEKDNYPIDNLLIKRGMVKD